MLKAFVIIIIISSNVHAMTIDEKLENKTLELQAIEIFKDIKCVTCEGQSIHDSESSTARDMRIFIREELESGKNKAQIKEYLIERYGADIVLTPPFNIHTYLLWFFPAVSLIFLIFLFRKKYIK